MATRADSSRADRTGFPGISPRNSALVLAGVLACVALLWPRLIAPHPDLAANHNDKAQGCCDILVATDVNAIKVMAEMCNIILQKRSDSFDAKSRRDLADGKLSKEVVSLCREEVNTTCGIDIAAFLDQNVRLGKTYKQILDEVRSYNSSNCLKMNYGVAPWSLGVPHVVGKFWVQDFGMRQERPPHLRPTPVHPALRERGRAIPPSIPGSPAVPTGPYKASAPLVQRAPSEGRVWSSSLNPYYEKDTYEPLPVGGMRPPMGGAGGVVPPPKSSVGFVMPIYTLCIVIFFLYTVFKMLFRRSATEQTQQFANVTPDPEFRRKVFSDNNRSNRSSPESNTLGDEELDILRARLAETERAMERIVRQMGGPLTRQDVPSHPYTNGSVHRNQREHSPLITKANEFISKKEPTPPSWEDSTPLCEKEIIIPKESSLPQKDLEKTPNITSAATDLLPPPEPKENHTSTQPLIEDKPVVVENKEENVDKEDVDKENIKDETVEKEEDKPVIDQVIRQIRSSVEKEKATVKVLGMEMTAHCEGGQKWMAQRPATPPVALPPRHPTPPVEVSSIYLEGSLPHLSRLLVSDSETLTEGYSDGDDKDPPVILSGKMTLSVINDESAKATPEKDMVVVDDITIDYEDDDFTTASLMTAPKQAEDDDLEGSEEEIEEEEVEEIEEEEEVEVDEEVDEEEEEDEIEELEVDEEVKVEKKS